MAIVLGICSFVLSALALYLTYSQKVRQDRFGSRKALSDTISVISSIRVEMSKLFREIDDPDELRNLRRSINARRRYLAYHAELLTREIPGLTADIDHLLIAGAFATTDPDRAKAHYEQAVAKSSNQYTRAINTRSFAVFMLGEGEFDVARKLFEEAIKANSDNDQGRRLRADNLMIWAACEQRFGFPKEAERRSDQALKEASGIVNQHFRERTIADIEARVEATMKMAKGFETQESITEPAIDHRENM
jgi:tetratricopeptide (TPR) repeat protein